LINNDDTNDDSYWLDIYDKDSYSNVLDVDGYCSECNNDLIENDSEDDSEWSESIYNNLNDFELELDNDLDDDGYCLEYDNDLIDNDSD
jgi:hypothetical protein